MNKRATICIVTTILIMLFILFMVFCPPRAANAEGFYGSVEVGYDLRKPFCNLTNDLTIGYFHMFGGIIGINLSAGIVTDVFNGESVMYWHPYLSTYRVRGEIIVPLFEDGFLVVGGLAKCSHQVFPGTWKIPDDVFRSWYYVPPTERVIYAAVRFGERIRW